jgi:GNAT superfamily N-acetyltransferase
MRSITPQRVPWSAYAMSRVVQLDAYIRLVAIRFPRGESMSIAHHTDNVMELVKVASDAYGRRVTYDQIWKNSGLWTADVLVVAIDNYGIAKGYCLGDIYYRNGVHKCLHIMDVAVAKEYRGYNIAVYMMKQAIKEMSRESRVEMFLALTQNPTMYWILKHVCKKIYPDFDEVTNRVKKTEYELGLLQIDSIGKIQWPSMGAKDATVKPNNFNIIRNWYPQCMYTRIPAPLFRSRITETFWDKLEIDGKSKSRHAFAVTGVM